MTAIAFSHEAVVLMAIRAASAHSGTQPGLSRHTWVLKVLLEDLQRHIPQRSAVAAALGRAIHPDLGITDACVNSATDRLLATQYLVPNGTGADATWTVANDRVGHVDEMLAMLGAAERSALSKAGQRALAMSLAWSKTSRA